MGKPGEILSLVLLSFSFSLTSILPAQEPVKSLPPDQLILISPHWEGVRYEFTQAFQKYYLRLHGRPVELHWRDLGGGTSQVEKAVNALYQSNPASCDLDLFFGGGMDPYENQKRLGHLTPYPLPAQILKEIPHQVQGVNLWDPDYTYYGAALSSYGILENRAICSLLHLPPVQTWKDLTNPTLASWISSADPRKSGSVHMIYEIILQAYGWKEGWAILYQMSGNIRSFQPDSPSPPKEVSAGEVAYGLTIDINGLSQQAFLGPDSVRFIIPPRLSIINPDGIAIFKGAPHLQVAQDFLNFVLSTEGQSLWMVPMGQPGGAQKFRINRLGILPALYHDSRCQPLVPLNPFTEQVGFRYDNALGSLRAQLLNELIGQTIIDVLPHLQKAWRAINQLPTAQATPLLTEFSEPFLDATEIPATADLWRKNRIAASRLSNQWMQAAVTRFDLLTHQAQDLANGKNTP